MSDKIWIATERIYTTTALLKPQRGVNSKAEHEKIAPPLQCLHKEYPPSSTASAVRIIRAAPSDDAELRVQQYMLEITIGGPIQATFG